MHKVSNVRLAACSPQTQTPLDALAYYTTEDMTSSQKHIVAFVLQAWGKHHLAYPTVRLIIFDPLGHTRPVANFCARAVKLRPHVTITFLTTDAFCDRLTKELARSFDDGDEHLAQRVRCGFARAALK